MMFPLLGLLRLGALPLAAAINATTPDALAPLARSQTVDGEVRASGPICHALPTFGSGDRFVLVVARQRDVPLKFELRDGAECALVAVDGPRDLGEEVRLTAVAPGNEHLEVCVIAAGEDVGSYRISLVEDRPLEEGDDARALAEDSLYRGRSLRERGDRNAQAEAQALFDSALHIMDRLGDRCGQARVLLVNGETRLLRGDAPAARALLEEALSRSRWCGDGATTARILDRLGVATKRLGDRRSARERYLEARQLARRNPRPGLEPVIVNDLAEVTCLDGDCVAACGLLQEALLLLDADPEPYARLTVLSNLGAIERYLGRPDAALVRYDEAVPLARRLGDAASEAGVANSVGAMRLARGELQLALDSYLRALDAAVSVGERRQEAFAALNLGHLFVILGEEDRAREFLLRSLTLNRELASPQGEAWVLMELGWLDESIGDNAAAGRSYEQALSVGRRANDRRTEAEALHGLGRLRLRLGDAAAAIPLFEETLTRHVSARDAAGQQGVLRDLGLALAAVGKPVASADALNRALELAGKTGAGYREAATRSAIARLEELRGNLPGALEQRRSVLQLLEAQRSELAAGDLRASFLSRWQDEYAETVRLLLQLDCSEPGSGHAAEAWAVAERARARGLAEFLARVGAGGEPAPAALERAYAEAAAALTDAQAGLLAARANTAPDETRVTSLRERVTVMARRLDIARWRLLAARVGTGRLPHVEPLALDRVQTGLREGLAVLEYVIGSDKAWAFVITRSELRAVELPIFAGVHDKVDALVQLLEEGGRRRSLERRRISAALYSALVSPVEGILTGANEVVIVPDRGLYRLPFEALIAPTPSASGLRPHYLTERWRTAYAPSASLFVKLTASDRAYAAVDPVLVCFADPARPFSAPEAGADGAEAHSSDTSPWPPLPGARREGRRIAALVGSARTRLFEGAAATESAVKADASIARARWLHFACHAVIETRHPETSGLLLAVEGTGIEDGVLRPNEVFELGLRAELVVLSGCRTALGRELPGEGLWGFVQAFLAAGVQSVVVSLWPLEDRSTEELMVSFYRGLLSGMSAADALRRARLELLGDPATADPSRWAGLILIGSPPMSGNALGPGGAQRR